MENCVTDSDDLNLGATELRLGLPGIHEYETPTRNNKRASSETADDCHSKPTASRNKNGESKTVPVAKAQVVGWPPIRSYRKNSLQAKKTTETGTYVKVSVDGAPYLRKMDLKLYGGYTELLKALQGMFKLTIGEYSEREGYKGSEYTPTYEDKDGDLMLVGDVPWDMFLSSCKRLRIIKGWEAS